MPECSDSPLVRKLGIKPASRVLFVNAPSTFVLTLGPLPPGVVCADIADAAEAGLDVIVFFTKSQEELRSRFAELAGLLAPSGGLWIAWPKKASKVATDLSDDIVRQIGLDHQLVDNKVCSIDSTWSGQRFVVRLKDRSKRTT